jgi:hypothetical protein
MHCLRRIRSSTSRETWIFLLGNPMQDEICLQSMGGESACDLNQLLFFFFQRHRTPRPRLR